MSGSMNDSGRNAKIIGLFCQRMVSCLVYIFLGATLVTGSWGAAYKREAVQTQVGNGCPESTPWPCKTPNMCLSFDFICDGEPDCPDNYDEDPYLCTAKGRPAKELLKHFIATWHSWLVPKFLGEGSTETLAKLLIESKNVNDYSRALKMNSAATKRLIKFLDAIKGGRQVELLLSGMPTKAWNDLYFLFSRIVDSGFLGEKAA